MGNATNITAEAEVVKALSDAKISGIVIGSLFGLIIIYRLFIKFQATFKAIWKAIRVLSNYWESLHIILVIVKIGR